MDKWYRVCAETAESIFDRIPLCYRSRTFSGIIGDIKVLPPKKAGSLIGRKKGLGLQYAYLYLTQGIDRGRGYQSCASEALKTVLGPDLTNYIGGKVLDVGCAVGVSAGVIGIDKVTGFDLFPDLLATAKAVDAITGAGNHYACADMTGTWPFECAFDTVICGLVCHHLKEQKYVVSFFNESNRVLKKGGRIIITFPAGSITRAEQIKEISLELRKFGFRTIDDVSGLILSTDNSNSLFWMFLIVAEKIEDISGSIFLHDKFDFSSLKTSETREKKGEKAKKNSPFRTGCKTH